jgi:ABC-2 type transport system permease protein
LTGQVARRGGWSRYARLLGVQLRSSLLLGMQYRSDFLLEGAVEVLTALASVVPLTVVYGGRSSIAGWTFPETLLVLGSFTLLQGVIEGAISPSLGAVVEHVRKGTLDFVLLKPADAQFLVSTSKLQPWRSVNVVTAMGLFGYAFHRIGAAPSASGVVGALVMLGAALAILYSLWFLTVSAAFHVVKVDNLAFLFSSVFDAARWPSSIFRGGVRIFFTWIVPLAVMTTFPAEALLGRLSGSSMAAAVAGGLGSLVVSRVVWLRSLAAYTSASS